MSKPENSPPTDDAESKIPEYSGPERRSGLDRRHTWSPHPPPGQAERRQSVRRRADRVSLEGTIRIGASGFGGRLYRRVRLQVPVICRPLVGSSVPNQPAQRGVTHTLAPGGLGMLLEQEFPVGTPMEVLVRFDTDLLAADVRVVSVIPQGSQFLHNCRFTQLGTADRNWLTEYLRIRDAPPA